MWRLRARFAAALPGRPGAPPPAITRRREELADGEARARAGLTKSAARTEKPPRWSAARRAPEHQTSARKEDGCAGRRSIPLAFMARGAMIQPRAQAAARMHPLAQPLSFNLLEEDFRLEPNNSFEPNHSSRPRRTCTRQRRRSPRRAPAARFHAGAAAKPRPVRRCQDACRALRARRARSPAGTRRKPRLATRRPAAQPGASQRDERQDSRPAPCRRSHLHSSPVRAHRLPQGATVSRRSARLPCALGAARAGFASARDRSPHGAARARRYAGACGRAHAVREQDDAMGMATGADETARRRQRSS